MDRVRFLRPAAAVAAAVALALSSYLATTAPAASLPGAALAYGPLALPALWALRRRPALLAASAAALALLGLAAWRQGWLWHYRWAYFLQSALPLLAVGSAFAGSLLPGRTALVTQLARLAQGDTLSPRLTRYTRGVTWAWALYLAALALTSLALFALAPATAWATFADLALVPLVLAMFVAESLARLWLLPPHERIGPLQAARAFARYMRQPQAAPTR